MGKLMKTFLLLIFFFSPAFFYAADKTGPEDLIYICEDIPPSNYIENGQLKGISVEVLKMLWKKMGCPEQKINVKPWARGYSEALAVPNTVLFSMSRTKEREKMFKWVGPIFVVKSVLLGRAKDNIHIKRLQDARKYRIGTIKDDVTEEYLLKNNFPKDRIESVSALAQNFEKLKNGRVDLIAHSLETFKRYMEKNSIDSREFTVVYILEENPNFYAFNINVPDTLINRFAKVLKNSRKEHLEILEKYKSGLR